MEFNLQAYLETMHADHREDTANLTKKLDEGFAAVTERLHEHELSDQRLFASFDSRIKPIEGVHKTARWLLGAVIVAMLTGAADIVFNHLGKEDRSATELSHPVEAGVRGR